MEKVIGKIVTNPRQMNRIFALLHDAYKNSDFPYTKRSIEKLPEVQIPAEQQGLANLWFYLAGLMRGMTKSELTASRVARLYQEDPELFDPHHAATLSAAAITRRLERIFGKLPPRQLHGKAWQRSSKVLAAWGGDILQVFDGVTTEKEMRNRILNKRQYTLPLKDQGFYGFQRKIAALLAYFLMEARLIPVIQTAPPIDFHHMRVLVGTGIISLENGRHWPGPIERTGDYLTREYLKRFPGMHPVEFARLLFILSREACALAVTDPDADWSDPKILGRYQRSCGRCPVERYCGQTAISESYYPKGEGNGSKLRVIEVIDRPKPSKGKKR
jgi:hypothetical protein